MENLNAGKTIIHLEKSHSPGFAFCGQMFDHGTIQIGLVNCDICLHSFIETKRREIQRMDVSVFKDGADLIREEIKLAERKLQDLGLNPFALYQVTKGGDTHIQDAEKYITHDNISIARGNRYKKEGEDEIRPGIPFTPGRPPRMGEDIEIQVDGVYPNGSKQLYSDLNPDDFDHE